MFDGIINDGVEGSGETALWRRVLLQAVEDAVAVITVEKSEDERPHVTLARRNRAEARRFFTSSACREDLEIVCCGAGLEPQAVREAVLRLIDQVDGGIRTPSVSK